MCIATISLKSVSPNAFLLLYGCMYSNLLLVLHSPVCILITETRSPEEVATDTSGEEVFAHHDTSTDQHIFSHVSLDPPPPTGTDVYLCQKSCRCFVANVGPYVCLYVLYIKLDKEGHVVMSLFSPPAPTHTHNALFGSKSEA